MQQIWFNKYEFHSNRARPKRLVLEVQFLVFFGLELPKFTRSTAIFGKFQEYRLWAQKRPLSVKKIPKALHKVDALPFKLRTEL